MIDIGTQIVLLIILGIMSLIAKRVAPQSAKYFGYSTLILFVIFAVLDILNAVDIVS